MTLSHPKGMYVLAFTEIFERLSFFTLSFLLVLYASAPLEENGLGWSKSEALTLGGIYTMAVYIFPIIGSFIADRFLGHFRAVIIGGFIIMLGHFFMLFSANTSFLYLALFLVASGTAFFKPCIPALLGSLYSWNDPRRESGYSWYYCGISLGILLAGVIGGLLLQKYGYHIALTSAGFGMAIGMFIFYMGRKYLVLSKSNCIAKKIKPIQISKKQKNSVIVLVISLVFFAFWTLIYNLSASGTISLFVENYTQKNIFNYEIPVTFFSSLEGLTILISTPFITYFLAYRSRKNKYPNFFSQMSFAMLLCTISLIYFTLLTLKFDNILNFPKPFTYYEIAFFIILFSISETIINPVMMSTISIIAPQKYKSFFQSIYLASFGLTGILAAKIGSYSFDKPFLTFLFVSIFITLITIIYYLVKSKMIHTVNLLELEQTSKLKKEAA